MKITRKIQKLFEIDSLLSAVDHVRRLSHPVPWAPMYYALDQEKLASLRERNADFGRGRPGGDSARFADTQYWIKVNIERAQDLNLDRRPPLRILDLGCGAGYFLYVCQRLGHDALGLDVDESELFRETLALMSVRRIVSRINAKEPLPEMERRFDLVTAHCICFQKLPSWKDGKQEEWGPDEWRFFLDDVRSRVLTENGSILLDFNPRGHGVYYSPEVGAFFREQGARIFRSKVLLGPG